MNKTQKRYKRKIKTKKVDFYLHEADLYEFAQSINFSFFVKEKLKELKKQLCCKNCKRFLACEPYIGDENTYFCACFETKKEGAYNG